MGQGLVATGVVRTSQNPAARRDDTWRFFTMSETRRKEKSSMCILWFVARGTDYLSLHVRYGLANLLRYDIHPLQANGGVVRIMCPM